MPVVQMPDGTQVNFPDTMSETSIRGLIAQKFPREVGEAGAAKPLSERDTTGHYAMDTSGLGPSVGEDVMRSIPSGFRSGAEMMLGGFGDVGKYQDQIAQWGAGKLGASPETAKTIGSIARRLTAMPLAATTDEIQSLTNPVVGPAYEAQTTPGKYANTAASFLPAALLPNGQAGIVQRVLEQAVLPGLASEGGGQLAEKLGKEGYIPKGMEPYARILGAIGGGVAPTIFRRAVTPFPASPEREQLAQTLIGEGVDLTAGQRTGSKMLRNVESELGGGAAANMVDRQGEQFTAAALRRAGVDAPRATPEVIDGAFTRIGQQFDDLVARNRLVPDPQMITDLRGTIREYGQLVPESARAPIVEGITNDIVDTIRRNGSIPGDSYQSLTSRIAKAARSTKDPELGSALRGIRETLDDAMERSIQAAGNSGDMEAWRTARNQYRNLMVIEKAATGAGENAAAGLISPSQLRNATVQQGRRAYARGQGDFAELARAGEGVMKPLPDSGTAGRTAARALGTSVPAAIGATLGGSIGNLPGGIMGAAAGAALPFAAGRAVLSNGGRAYLGNQAMAGLPATDPRIAAVIAALLNRPKLSAPTK